MQGWLATEIKKKHKKIKAYNNSIYRKPTIERCLLILDSKPFRS